MNAYSIYGRAVQQYQRTDIAAADEDHPHQRVELVFSAVLSALAQAQRAHRLGQPGPRGEQIGQAMTLIAMLRAALDHEAAPELAGPLDALYAYCGRRLLSVALNDDGALQETIDLMVTIKSGWDAITVTEQRAAA